MQTKSKTPPVQDKSLGIDVDTADVAVLIAELLTIPEVSAAVPGGMYNADHGYSQVHVQTSLSEDELCDWLYANSTAEYIGTFEM